MSAPDPQRGAGGAAPANRLYHLAMPDDWDRARTAGEYTMSTRGMTLDQVGFIHLSFEHQWQATRERFYADVNSDLVLLEIDPTGLAVIKEVGNPETGELFPHLYGPLPVSAVVDAKRIPPDSRRGRDTGDGTST